PVAMTDVSLHEAIAEAGHNSIYVTVLQTLEGLLANTRGMVESIGWVRERSVADHEAIVKAIEARNPERAAEAMRRHLVTAVEAMEAARAARDGDTAVG